jgi:hypothetical protein
MAAWMFTDAFKMSRPWMRYINDTPDYSIPLDRRGNPVQLTTGQEVFTSMFLGSHYPVGPYTAWWQGDGNVSWSGDVNQGSIQTGTATGSDDQAYHTARFTVTPGTNPYGGIQMIVRPSMPVDNGPIHDVYVWMPDYQGHSFVGQMWQPGASFSPFHPLFLERLAPFHTLRCNGLQDTVTSSIQHWSDRRDVNFETQQSRWEDGLFRGSTTGGNTTVTLNDTSQSWTSNQWAGVTVHILGTGPDAGQVRTITANTGNQLTLNAAWETTPNAGSPYAILVSGPQTSRSTSGNVANTLNDSTQSWTAGQLAGLEVRITGGTGFNQVRAITGNSVNRLTIGTPWAVVPDATSTFAIMSQPGIAPEYLAQLANDLHADVWVAVPHMADLGSTTDNYVSGLARLFHDSLNANQHVNLEWSNEAWSNSPDFYTYQWITSQLPANPTQDDVARFVAQQATRAFGVWSSAVSGPPGQLIRVLSGQGGNDFYNQPLLDAMLAPALGGNFDAFSVGAYFGPESWPTTITVDQVLAAVAADIPTTLRYLRIARGQAEQASLQLGRHIAFVAYEVGPAFESHDAPLATTRVVTQAAIDPGVYGVYSRFLSQLSSTGLELFNNHEYTQPFSPDSAYGSYGALLYQDQPIAEAPKYRALTNALAGYTLRDDGVLMRSGSTVIDTGVASFRAASSASAMSVNGSLYVVGTNGILRLYSSAGWTMLDTGVTSFSVANGTLYDLETGGGLWRYDRSGWARLDAGVVSINVAANGALFELETQGRLWTLTGSGWTWLDSGVGRFLLATDGTLVELETNGQLWTWNCSTPPWTRLATGITFFGLDRGGYTIIAQPSGTFRA